jgi:hypothetical protein
MFVGDIHKINLGVSSFARLREQGALYVDKSRFIEHFLEESSDVQLIARQRRMGKSLNMDMLRCFLTDTVDNRQLFQGLYIEQSPVWEQAHSAPVFFFDFKGLTPDNYRTQIKNFINEHILSYLDINNAPWQSTYEQWVRGETADTDGLYLLTQIVHTMTGKKSYLLIDEYDKLLFDLATTEQYEETRRYFTTLLSVGLKGNNFLAKALLSGVTRISHEGMLSGLNNITTYDIFKDKVYPNDYGFTEAEMDELAVATGFDREQARDWYNGIKVGGQDIY